MLPAPLKRFLTAPGRRFAVLVVLGMLIVATPMAEVWRRLGLELHATVQARRGLEPVVLAVQTQKALMSHRPLAAAVLTGRTEKETERLHRQRDVDGGLAGLLTSLEARGLGRALRETDQLRQDWSALLSGIGRRQMRPAASDAAHQVLIEQTFVIVDVSAEAAGLYGQAGRAFDAADLALALRVLPRFAAALGHRAAAVDGETTAEPETLLRSQARRVALEAARALAAVDAADRAADPSLVRALLSLQQAAGRLAEVERQGTPEARAAELSSVDAAAALATHLDRGLAEAAEVLEVERRLTACALWVMLVIGAIAASIALPRKSVTADAGGPDPDGFDAGPPAAPQLAVETPAASAGPESERPTSDLLQRLRQRQARATDATPPSPPTRQ